MTQAPMEQIAIDILGPLPETLWKNNLFLITKWTESCQKPNCEAVTVAETLNTGKTHTTPLHRWGISTGPSLRFDPKKS